MNRIGRKLLLSAVALGAALVATEVGLRVADWSYSPMTIELGDPSGDKSMTDWRGVHAFEDAHFEYDPQLIWRPRPKRAVFNAQGLRGEKVPRQKAAQAYYVFAVGDSNTLGNAGGTHWPGSLGSLLEKSHPHVSAYNAGVWGYSSYQGLRRLEELLRFEPDLVLISFGGNDPHHVYIPDEEYVQAQRALDEELSRLRVYQLWLLLRDRLRLRGAGSEALVPRVSLADYEANLNRMIDLCQERGTDVALLTRPFFGKSPHELWWKNFAPEYNAATMRIARERGVPALDVDTHFKLKLDCFVNESHFNEKGRRQMAMLMFEFLSEHFDFTP